MKNILFIRCSPKTSGSYSGTFAESFVTQLQEVLSPANVVLRDLGRAPLPHVTHAHTLASEKQEGARNEAEQEALRLSDTLIEELEASDVLVIATPMHNFTLPSVLKAWVDHVVRAHRTIRLTPQGKVGLIGDKHTYIIVSSGGHHSAQPAWQPDFLTPYLTEILRTVGITRIEFIYLEAMNHGPAAAEQAVSAAQLRTQAILATLTSTTI
ncbi:FMN-dependent NADH-azoreductase [Methylophilus rhizosphaerae]|uniref:FMN dependent NADH:quinone oxidoreductase n=1 Tax=Methylophilus rhizosphaerae TaxID=492660 RepID=A0A1G9ET68_9PROT|nr:NAD(P)H-dependent oxidoreductase [Methylophilus rhizosphaerae]SDK79362.1 FMN-dependent NADH-azoreductase [Methylophilus rhizosphaerae]